MLLIDVVLYHGCYLVPVVILILGVLYNDVGCCVIFLRCSVLFGAAWVWIVIIGALFGVELIVESSVNFPVYNYSCYTVVLLDLT